MKSKKLGPQRPYYSTKWEFDDAEPGPMGKPIGEITHRRNKNVEDLPRQPKYTNPCPWRGPYKGNHKGGRPKGISCLLLQQKTSLLLQQKTSLLLQQKTCLPRAPDCLFGETMNFSDDVMMQ